MTSRQPGTMPPGTAGGAAIPDGDAMRADRETAAARRRRAFDPRWPTPVLPLTLLIIVGLAGLRGEVNGPQWDGPLHGDAVAVGIPLEIALVIVLAVTIRRLATRARARRANATPGGAVAVKLRRVLVFVLSAGIIAVAATMVIGVTRHLFSVPARAHPGGGAGAAASPVATRPGRHLVFLFPFVHFHLTTALLYALLVLVFMSAVVLRTWQARRWYRPPRWVKAYHDIAPDSQDLLEVVEAGRSALRAVDDVRAAIIACYLAMETSLDEHGAARAIADTPDELLTRATALGIVHGTAATRLTALFYEARFSSHPLDRSHREAAGQALAELAAELAGGGAAGTSGRRSRANGIEARA
jgi:hypothetical protein